MVMGETVYALQHSTGNVTRVYLNTFVRQKVDIIALIESGEQGEYNGAKKHIPCNTNMSS